MSQTEDLNPLPEPTDTRKVKVTAKAYEEKFCHAISKRKTKLSHLTCKMNQKTKLMDEYENNNLPAVETRLTVEFNKLFASVQAEGEVEK